MTKTKKAVLIVLVIAIIAVAYFQFIPKHEEVTMVSAPVDTATVVVDSVEVVPVVTDSVVSVDTAKTVK